MRKLILIFVLAAICALTAPAQTKHTTFYYQRATLFELLPVDSTSIVFMGNSLTNGCEWHELLGMPNALNRGISGDIVEGAFDRIDPVLKGRPAKIFLLTGVNDVAHHLSTDSIVDATTALVKYIRENSPSTKLYVQSLLPIDQSYERFRTLDGKEQQIRDINAAVKPRVEALGATWINLYPHFADTDGNLRDDLTNDGLHLLGNGYLVWRDIILPYVME